MWHGPTIQAKAWGALSDPLDERNVVTADYGACVGPITGRLYT